MRLTPVTTLLLALLAAGFALQLIVGERLLASFALWPLGTSTRIDLGRGSMEVAFAPWQLLSYAFLHGNLVHLAFNAFALLMFGPPIERVFGLGAFLNYWLLCVVGAAISQLATLGYTMDPARMVPTIGASGGVFGVLLVSCPRDICAF